MRGGCKGAWPYTKKRNKWFFIKRRLFNVTKYILSCEFFAKNHTTRKPLKFYVNQVNLHKYVY